MYVCVYIYIYIHTYSICTYVCIYMDRYIPAAKRLTPIPGFLPPGYSFLCRSVLSSTRGNPEVGFGIALGFPSFNLAGLPGTPPHLKASP